MSEDTRPCVVCGTDVLGSDFVMIEGMVIFAVRGDREDQSYYAREDGHEECAEYFCRGCIGNFEAAMWLRIDRERAEA